MWEEIVAVMEAIGWDAAGAVWEEPDAEWVETVAV